MSKRVVCIVIVLLASLSLSGCVQVAPWERGILAKSQMSLNPNPLQSEIRAHSLSSREAAARISTSGGGGGCGCY